MPEITVTSISPVVVVTDESDSVTIAAETLSIAVEIANPGPQGVQGPPGADGSIGGFEHVQSVAMGTWTITVPAEFGRRPAVEVYVGGERVVPDLVASSTTVTLTFAAPVAGTAVLT